MMTKEDTIEALESGKYEIEYDNECSCWWDWNIDGRNLQDNHSPQDCWSCNDLLIGGRLIAHYYAEMGEMHYHTIDDKIEFSPDWLDDETWDKIEAKLKDLNSDNELHNKNRRQALVDWLLECGYELDRDDQRGFANEYTMILREIDNPTLPTRKEAEEWADQYLYVGDDATTAYNNFRFES